MIFAARSILFVVETTLSKACIALPGEIRGEIESCEGEMQHTEACLEVYDEEKSG